MRSSGLRRVACSRSISRKPVTLPIVHLCRAHQRRRNGWRTVSLFRALDAKHALVFMREDLDEVGTSGLPVFKDPRSTRAAGEFAMALEQSANECDVFLKFQRFQIHGGLVAAASSEVAGIVVDIRDTAAHARGKVAARCT